jgi:hypothetical protein
MPDVWFFSGFLLGLLFDPEAGGRMFLQKSVNIYWTTWSYIPEDDTVHRLKGFGNSMLRRIFGPKGGGSNRRLEINA